MFLAQDLWTFGLIHFYRGELLIKLYKMMHQNNIIFLNSSWSFKQKQILKIEMIKFYSLGIFFFKFKKHKTANYNGIMMITLFVFWNIEHPYIIQ